MYFTVITGEKGQREYEINKVELFSFHLLAARTVFKLSLLFFSIDSVMTGGKGYSSKPPAEYFFHWHM